MKKWINGEFIDMTPEEITELEQIPAQEINTDISVEEALSIIMGVLE